MTDPRFYDALGPVRASELARLCGGEPAGEDAAVERVAPYDADDLAGAVVYVDAKAGFEALAGKSPAAIIAPPALADAAREASCSAILADDPKVAFAKVTNRLHRERPSEFGDGVHPGAEIDDGAVLHAGAKVADGAEIGADVEIGPGAVIGRGVKIGRGSKIGANATLYCAILGENCTLLSGARLGEAGFGFAPTPEGLMRIPQIGRVVLDDWVEVGANACIDRGALGDTTIGYGTKIDNLVQVGHNCRIGRFCILAGLSGVSGSVVLEDGVMLGGQAGVADHITLHAGARLAAGAGLMHDIPAGETWGGVPARTAKSWMRETVALSRLAKRRR